MTNEELNTEVYEKLYDAQKKYKTWLLSLPPKEILDHAYEYTVREDIVLAMESLYLTDDSAKALLSSPALLDEIYHEFEKVAGSQVDTINSCIVARADAILEEQHEILKNTPVYLHSARYAREHGELAVYRESHKANVLCKEAIEDAISENYHDNRLDPDCAKGVLDRFGADRAFFILAYTVWEKDWDGRFSQDNKQWAKNYFDPNITTSFEPGYKVTRAHPGLVDLFINQARRYSAPTEERKPSLQQMLEGAQAAETPQTPGKQREMER